jgi:hypothetical protein
LHEDPILKCQLILWDIQSLIYTEKETMTHTKQNRKLIINSTLKILN